jgi:hypothetical protein
MAITYPIKLPGLDLPIAGESVPISSIRFKPRSVVAISASPFTFQQQVQVHQGQIWAADIHLPPLEDDEAQEWIAALLSLNGIQGTFYLGDPAHRQPRGSPTGIPVVDGAGQTGQSLATKGWGLSSKYIITESGFNLITEDDKKIITDQTFGSSGMLLAGDWIQLGSGSTQRIYRVLKNVNADDDGKAVIDIWPRLRESPADDALLVLQNTMGIFRMTDNEMIWDIDDITMYGIELTVAEAI